MSGAFAFRRLLLLLVMLAAVRPAAGQAVQGVVSIDAQPLAAGVQPVRAATLGERVVVSIVAVGMEMPPAGVQIALAYDAGVLKPLFAAPGSALGPAIYELEISLTGGMARVGWLSQPLAGSQNGLLASIEFEAIATGVSPLTLSKVTLSGAEGTPISIGVGPAASIGVGTNPCLFRLSATNAEFSKSGGPAQVAIDTDAACSWGASNTTPWLTLGSAGGSGKGALAFTVAENTSKMARSGEFIVAGQKFSLTQAGVISFPPFGVVDTPQNGLAGASGAVAVTGWALDDVDVTRVRIMRDAVAPEPAGALVFLGEATQVNGARPDIDALYKGYPQSNRGGWGYMLLTNMLPNRGNGTYTLHVFADDPEGNSVSLGSRTFTSNNLAASKPFGTIDTPPQGGVISGQSYVNFGWALTPQPKFIPTDGSTIRVFIDGAPIGTVTYNNRRDDIAGLFPGYANTNGAVGFRSLDTTTLSDGVHTIAWVVTDNAEEAEGIGSRFFTVSNFGASSLRAASTRVSSRPGLSMEPAAPESTAAPGTAAVRLRHGFVAGPLREVEAGRDGMHLVDVAANERIEVRLRPPSGAAGCGVIWSGEVRANGTASALPIGSSLDAERGIFYWHPAAAFRGIFPLAFEWTSCDGQRGRVLVQVTVALPK